MLQAGARYRPDQTGVQHAKRRLAQFGEQFVAVQTSFARAAAVLDFCRCVQSTARCSISGFIIYLRRIAVFPFSTKGRSTCGWIRVVEGAADRKWLRAARGDFRTSGEEPAARKIARRLVEQLRSSRLPHESRWPMPSSESFLARKDAPGDPVLQALRMTTTSWVLKEGLEQLSEHLAPGGRFAV
jgi:16S rRNA C1402 N4-methylase RsmH